MADRRFDIVVFGATGFTGALTAEYLARNAPADTFIIKTVAILPRPELRGLGSLLVGQVQQIARELGFQRCIGALMHERNTLVRNISSMYGKLMRRYTLFAKELAA